MAPKPAPAAASAASAGERHVLLMIDSILAMGGAETLAVELAARLDPSRYRRTVCVTRWAGSERDQADASAIIERLEGAGIAILGLDRSSRQDVRAWRPLVRFLRDEDVDLIHAHKFGSNAWAVLSAKLANVPAVVAHEHMRAYADGSWVRRLVDRAWIAPGASAFVAVSEEGRRQMIEIERVRSDRVVCIRNGVPPVAGGDGRRVRGELGIEPDEGVIGTLGHLRPEKALDVLVQAVADAGGAGEDGPHLLIAGEGPERGRLEAMIEAYGIGSRVHLLGQRRDVPDLLAAFDLAVCCSDFEGGPLSVIEYMAAGLPTVATAVGGLPELVEDSTTGLLVPPRDPGALGAAMGKLLDDAALRERLGARAYERYEAEYSIDDWVRRIEDLYETVLP